MKSVFLQHFENSLLTNATMMLNKEKSVTIMKFVSGKFAEVIKQKKLDSAEEAVIREEIQENLFPLLDSTVQDIKKASIELVSSTSQSHLNKKNPNKAKIGSFILEDQGLYFGIVMQDEAKGYGVYFTLSGTIKILHVKDTKFDGLYRMIEGGLVMDSECKNGEFAEKSRIDFTSDCLQLYEKRMEESQNRSRYWQIDSA